MHRFMINMFRNSKEPDDSFIEADNKVNAITVSFIFFTGQMPSPLI